MTIHLPESLETLIREEVQRGHFASPDEMVAEIVKFWIDQTKNLAQPCVPTRDPALGSIGAMRGDAELLDEIGAHAMTLRGRS